MSHAPDHAWSADMIDADKRILIRGSAGKIEDHRIFATNLSGRPRRVAD